MTLAPGRLTAGLPSGAAPVAVGLGVLGACSFAFLAVAGRALGPERFAELAIFWVLLHTVGPGAFLPLEQQLSRSVAERTGAGRGSRDLVRQAVLVAAGTTGLLVLLALAAGPALAGALLGGSTALLWALVAGTAATGAAHVARGTFAGCARWGRYGTQLGLDGLLRASGATGLALAGVTATSAYALALVLSLTVSTVVAAGRPSGYLHRDSGASWTDLRHALGWLLIGSVAVLALANAAPLGVQLLAGREDAAVVGSFVAAVVVARVPLLLFAAVQAALLPALTRQAVLGDHAGFRGSLGRLIRLVAVGGTGFAALALLVGPEVLRAAFGPGFAADRADLVLLVLATAGLMLVTVLGQGLVALRAYRSAALAAVAGVAVFTVMAAALDAGPARAVAVALVAAVALTVGLLGVLLRDRLVTWEPARA